MAEARLYAAFTAAIAAMAVSGIPSSAFSQTRSATAWRDLTVADLEAAYDIVARNHPGAATSAADTTFQRALEAGRKAGMERALQVTGYEGWLATLRAFAVAFDDPHISLSTRLSISTLRWPGFVVSRRGAATVVATRDTAGGDAPPIGAQVISCDGVAVDQYSRARLGVYRGSWDVASQRVRNTPFLLIDDGNPFVPPATRCVISDNGTDRTVELRWRTIANAALQERLREGARVGRAGFGVRQVGGGWWISLESMNARAQAVLDSALAHAGAIHSAPFVVVDVRGNGGGSSEWGRRLAHVLVGQPRTEAAMQWADRETASPLCGTSWRASPDVEETIEGYVRDLGPRFGQQSIDAWRRDVDSVRAARIAGRELAPAPRPCPPAAPAVTDSLPRSTMTGRLILLTDHACFSSCLLMAGLFRAVGAVHVGEGTDFSTRYMEVRGFALPSGLGRFATLQKVSFGMPARIGPFEPEIVFAGPIDDTTALEAWVTQVASGTAK